MTDETEAAIFRAITANHSALSVHGWNAQVYFNGRYWVVDGQHREDFSTFRRHGCNPLTLLRDALRTVLSGERIAQFDSDGQPIGRNR